MNANELSAQLLEQAFSYSAVMVDAPPEITDPAYTWGQLNIPDDVLVTDLDGGKGRERSAHVTVFYGLTIPEPNDAIYRIAHTTSPFPILVGAVSLFRVNPEYDVVKCDVASPWLHRLHAQVKRAAPNEETFPDYRPHMTLAYVQKGSCDQLEGMRIFAEGDNEFIAYGMVFKGYGEEDAADRCQEVLLFSKVKAHTAVAEAVVGPTQADMREIRGILQHAQADSNGDPMVFTELANDELRRLNIQFVRHPLLVSAGMPAMADHTGLYLLPPAHPVTVQALDWYLTAIHHELVHGWQMNRMSDPEMVSDKATAYVMPNGRTVDSDRYLQQKQEVMAHAASMVHSWEKQRLSPEQMRQRLKSGNWGFGEKYFYARKRFPKVFNTYCKYAAQYIDAFEQEPLAESSEPPAYDFDIEREIENLPHRQVYLKQQLDAKTISHKDAVEYAAREAESVLYIWEKEFPDDKRPRKAIAAAWAWWRKPTEINAQRALTANYEAQDVVPAEVFSAKVEAALSASFAAYAAYCAGSLGAGIETDDVLRAAKEAGRSARQAVALVRRIGEAAEPPEREADAKLVADLIGKLELNWGIYHPKTGLWASNPALTGIPNQHWTRTPSRARRFTSQEAKRCIANDVTPETASEVEVRLLDEDQKDPRNGPDRADYQHVDQPEPFKELPFPASADDLSKFMRGRRKKRWAKPIL